MATAVTSMRIPTELNERYSRLAKETAVALVQLGWNPH